MDWMWFIRQKEESGTTSRAWPEKLEEWTSHLLKRGRYTITSRTKSAPSSDSTAATLKEWKGRKWPLAPVTRPHTLLAGKVEAMGKSEKKKKIEKESKYLSTGI